MPFVIRVVWYTLKMCHSVLTLYEMDVIVMPEQRTDVNRAKGRYRLNLKIITNEVNESLFLKL